MDPISIEQYIQEFDQENEALRAQIKELTKQNLSLQAQLSGLKAAQTEDTFYHAGKEQELYPFERNDLLYSILSQVRYRYEENSRGRVLIDSMLEANPRKGEGNQIAQMVKDAFTQQGTLASNAENLFQKAGFTLDRNGTHIKITFHQDKRYTFSIARTPSDKREGQNTISDILKIIAIERKI